MHEFNFKDSKADLLLEGKEINIKTLKCHWFANPIIHDSHLVATTMIAIIKACPGRPN